MFVFRLSDCQSTFTHKIKDEFHGIRCQSRISVPIHRVDLPFPFIEAHTCLCWRSSHIMQFGRSAKWHFASRRSLFCLLSPSQWTEHFCTISPVSCTRCKMVTKTVRIVFIRRCEGRIQKLLHDAPFSLIFWCQGAIKTTRMLYPCTRSTQDLVLLFRTKGASQNTVSSNESIAPS